jgi:ABC-type branched-subunit amino acid transport system substrate-binding protein
MKKRTSTALMATLGAALLAATGCAGDPGSAEPTPTEAAAALSESTIETLVAAGQGAAEAAGPDEIVIGWVNADSGPGSTPELTAQTEAAIDLINTQLGGAAGGTIVLEKCEVTSEESGLECGQQFANNDDIVAVLQGNIAAGSASFHSVLDDSGIPLVGALPLTGDDGMALNGYYTAPGSFSTVPAVLEVVGRYLHPKSVAVVTVEGEVVSTQIGAALGGALKGMGIDVKQTAIELSATDLTAPLVAAGVQDADLIIPLVILPPQCIALDGALKALATDATVLSLSACQSTAVREALGDYPAWTYLAAYPNPDVSSDDPEVQAQLDAYKEWYATLPASALDAVIPLQGALTMQHHLNAAAEPTREGVAAAAKEWEGPVFLGSPTVAYGSVTSPIPLPALPSLATRAYAYAGDGAWTDVTDGAWLGLTKP